MIETVPNVHFTAARRQELRNLSGRSPENYALACSTGDNFRLDFPAANKWANHPLLTWGATRLSWVAVHQREAAEATNAFVSVAAADAIIATARQVIALAQRENPTNGALSLAEAAVCFAIHDDAAALAALETSASHPLWSADSEKSFTTLAKLYELASLSKLDAVSEANAQSPQTWAASLQGIIKKHLNRLMTAAVKVGEDDKFGKLLGLLVELRKVEWQDQHVDLWNNFRNFAASDEFIIAAAGRTGRAVPEHFFTAGNETESYYYENREFRTATFREFLKAQAAPQIAARFWGQDDAAGESRNFRRQLHHQQLVSIMPPWLVATGSGCLSLFIMGLLLVGVLSEVPYVLSKSPGPNFREWPCHRAFWFLSIMAMVAGSFFIFRIFSALGVADSNESGFGLHQNHSTINPDIQRLLLAVLLAGCWQLILLLAWIMEKKPVRLSSWPVIAVLAEFYFVAILLAGFFRSATVEVIRSQFL